jgi:phospholipase/lecithinase/hemolysin
MRKLFNLWSLLAIGLAVVLASGSARAITFEQIVVFGGSVSDPGNAFALTHIANKPPYDDLDDFLIPTGPYAKGGHHFSNGPTWIEQLAKRIGLNRDAQAAFRSSNRHATNYAVGAARSIDVPGTFDMPEQVGVFLAEHGFVAPSEALYVIDFGGNDVRDALVAADPPGSLNTALSSLGLYVNLLYTAGARKFLFVNVADIGALPSVRLLDVQFPGAAQAATNLTLFFNAGLDAIINSLPADAEVEVLDVFGIVHDMIAHPQDYGLKEVEDACITPNVAPFSCKKPDQYLFWDGVHPTRAVQEIFAEEAFDVLNPVVAKK